MVEWLPKFARFLNSFEYIIEKDDNPVFYHYTNYDTAKIILENHTLRFSNRLYLNDKSEGYYVLHIAIKNIDKIAEDSVFKTFLLENLKRRIKKIKKDGFDIYQCSFSVDKDSLCLWNYYSGERGKQVAPISGANLKFSMNEVEDFIKPDTDNTISFLYGKVCYDEDKQIETIKKIVDRFLPYYYEHSRDVDFIAAYCVDKILMQGIFFKSPYFRIENEFRIAINLFVEINEDNKLEFVAIRDEIKEMDRYTYDGPYKVPYVDLKFNKKNLKRICVSPTMNQKEAEEQLGDILKKYSYSYEDIPIDGSKIPVRY